MPVRRATLGHVALTVRNLRKSEAFYREILGMAVSDRNPRMRMSFLSFGKEHHDVALIEAGKGAPSAENGDVAGLHHFCVYVGTSKEVDDLVPRLKKKKIPIVSGPEILEVARNRSVSFLDPDGNRVEVACNAHKFRRKSRER
ncbi:MAG: VOC family protein [Deltaproteobacteria bacterium]|nr:VOC family protein [Deltaproteobacteria bacterium]